MKKLLSVALVVTLVIAFCSFSTSAEEPQVDPYYEYHLQISDSIAELRTQRNEQIEPLQREIQTYRNASMQLYNTTTPANYTAESQSTYDKIISITSLLEGKISDIQDEYYSNVQNYLISMGMTVISEFEHADWDSDIHMSATDAGLMQTTSSVSYDPNTDEFFYFVEYDYQEQNIWGAYLGLHDSWGEYDLVSMQHRESTDWHWDNIIVTAELAYGFAGSSMAGKADKYQILDNGVSAASAVSNRNDFWNGCIFNIRDSVINGPQNFSSEIRYVTLEGWLKPAGETTATQVKSEYEHNYDIWALSTISLGETTLNDESFSMEVVYTNTSGSWGRSAGSYYCTIPD